jgi:hypothetical protein
MIVMGEFSAGAWQYGLCPVSGFVLIIATQLAPCRLMISKISYGVPIFIKKCSSLPKQNFTGIKNEKNKTS